MGGLYGRPFGLSTPQNDKIDIFERRFFNAAFRRRPRAQLSPHAANEIGAQSDFRKGRRRMPSAVLPHFVPMPPDLADIDLRAYVRKALCPLGGRRLDGAFAVAIVGRIIEDRG